MHRAEEILEAVKAALTGLPTTGARVERDRVYPPEECPALSLVLGAEEPLNDAENLVFQDSLLEFKVVVQIKSGSHSSELNKIKAEVYGALMANRQQGLSYVHDTGWQGDSEPEPERGEIKTNRCEMRFAVAYRHSTISKEA